MPSTNTLTAYGIATNTREIVAEIERVTDVMNEKPHLVSSGYDRLGRLWDRAEFLGLTSRVRRQLMADGYA